MTFFYVRCKLHCSSNLRYTTKSLLFSLKKRSVSGIMFSWTDSEKFPQILYFYFIRIFNFRNKGFPSLLVITNKEQVYCLKQSRRSLSNEHSKSAKPKGFLVRPLMESLFWFVCCFKSISPPLLLSTLLLTDSTPPAVSEQLQRIVINVPFLHVNWK